MSTLHRLLDKVRSEKKKKLDSLEHQKQIFSGPLKKFESLQTRLNSVAQIERNTQSQEIVAELRQLKEEYYEEFKANAQEYFVTPCEAADLEFVSDSPPIDELLQTLQERGVVRRKPNEEIAEQPNKEGWFLFRPRTVTPTPCGNIQVEETRAP